MSTASLEETVAQTSEGVRRPPANDDRPWHTEVNGLIFLTAAPTPLLIAATAYLFGGMGGFWVSLPAAGMVYTALMLNDRLVVREQSWGRSVRSTLLIRALVPIVGTSMASLGVFLWWFADDIDAVIAKNRRAVLSPVTAEITKTVDGEISSAKAAVTAARLERADLQKRYDVLIDTSAADEKAAADAVSAAQKDVTKQRLMLNCESDGSKCLPENSGRAGDQGPLSKTARHRLTAAEETVTKAEAEQTALQTRLGATRRTLLTKLETLDAPADRVSSIAGLQATADRLAASRDVIIRQRVTSHPDVAATKTATGLGDKLVILTARILEHPTLLLYALLTKIGLTAFELMGILRGVSFARHSQQGRERRAAAAESDLQAQIASAKRKKIAYDAEVEFKVARIVADKRFDSARKSGGAPRHDPFEQTATRPAFNSI